MEKTEQSLKKLEKTLERYQKNKTLVSPDLLEGVYKISFFKLKIQLAKETTDYVRNYCYEGLKVFQSESQALKQQAQEEIEKSGIEKNLERQRLKNMTCRRFSSSQSSTDNRS